MNEEIVIKNKDGTPYVSLSLMKRNIKIKGNSYSEEIHTVYDEILNWINQNFKKFESELTIEFALYVINSISQKRIMQILNELLNNNFKKITININWTLYKDEFDTIDFIDDLEEIFKLKINKIFSINKKSFF